MYLKELEIFGFKSFPQKTSLKFEPGITVVVGPNGCGKSNVFDSIKWALGEQSPKSLRGTKMEDIIFNGTENHPPLNYAEVTLNFCNEDRYLPIDYKEVSVARRLYRSGESQYFINKNIVRLKDVQELFMGTGIGEATYSFVEQGKIEIFLSYKPEDKRLIFDEASGIVKYKERKRETLRRLDEAEENLLRLEDIMIEVRRQIRYLERQVEKAKKYKEVQANLIATEKKIATLQTFELQEKTGKMKEELESFKEKEKDKNSQLDQAKGNWEELNEQLKVLRVRAEETSGKIITLQAQIQSSNSHSVVNMQRIKEIEERDIVLEQTKRSLEQRLHLQEERSKQEFQRMQSIESGVKDIDTQINTLETEKNDLKIKIDAAKATVKDNKVKVLDLENKKVQSHNALIEVQTMLSSLTNRKKRLTLDKARLDTLLTENNDSFKVVEEEVLSNQENLRALQYKKNSLADKERELVSTIEENKTKIVDKEKELLELTASYEFLKDLHIKYETFSEKVKITVIFDEEPKNINKLVASLQDAEFRKQDGVFKAQIEAKVVSFEEQQLEEMINLAKKTIEELKDKSTEAAGQRERITEDLQGESSQIDELRKRLQAKLQERDSLKKEVERLEEESELLNQEDKTNLEEINDCQGKQKTLSDEVELYQEQLLAVNRILSESQGIIDTGLERIKEVDIEVNRIQAGKQSLFKEKEALSSKVSLFQDEMNNINNSLEQGGKEKQENILRIDSFNKQIEELRVKANEDEAMIANHTKAKEDIDQQEIEINKNRNQAKDFSETLEQEGQKVRSLTYNKRLEIQSLEYEEEKIKDYLKQVYDIEFQVVSLDGDINLDNLLGEKEKDQKRIKSLGEVNLVAIEEFQELKKREDFLDSQKQDLVTSKDNLKKAIAKINRTSRELFLETFYKIEVEFKKNFKFLFNGGRANLILIDKDNILESGVEIEVQPPGKKLQNVSLLSGGEKALTAIALIFSIFSVRPSPLCVLDEIDAPLDEANVDRFNHLLKEFSAFSQFILITHNKKSMSNADVLYGVTMQEKGISKLVSVKFASDQEPAAV